jgi:5-(aminomethyl)-3-furanmethanol phosphate kinase
MSAGLTVAKVGGSLYDFPDLRSRLRRWLAEQTDGRVLLVPGGGATADVVRRFDAAHGLGEEEAHWLAIRALAFNAAFLAALLGDTLIVEDPRAAARGISILDAFAFAALDERQTPTRCLPHTWAATSDAVAARAAVVAGAARLILLKSVTLPQGIDWIEASRRGFVDPVFPEVIREAPRLVVEAINFRE